MRSVPGYVECIRTSVFAPRSTTLNEAGDALGGRTSRPTRPGVEVGDDLVRSLSLADQRPEDLSERSDSTAAETARRILDGLSMPQDCDGRWPGLFTAS